MVVLTDDQRKAMFWHSLGRTYWGDDQRWLSERGDYHVIAAMPLRQIVNTLNYLERHAAHALGIEWPTDRKADRDLVRQAAARWCPPYPVLQATARFRKEGRVPTTAHAKDIARVARMRAAVSRLQDQWKKNKS